MRRIRRQIAAALASMLCGAPALAAAPPVEAYAVLPAVQSVRLSPDGSQLAMIGSGNGHADLVIYRPGDGTRTAIDVGDFKPLTFVWKTDKRLIWTAYSSFQADPQLGGARRIVAMDADGTHKKLLGNFYSGLVSLLPHDPDHVLIERPTRWERNVGATTVYRVDVNDGSEETAQRDTLPVTHWIADPSGVIRLGEGIADTTAEVLVKASHDDVLRPVYAVAANRAEIFNPLAFSATSPDILDVTSDQQGRPALYEYNLTSRTYTRTIAADPQGTIEPLLRDDRLIGYVDYGPKNRTAYYFDPDWSADLAKLAKLLPGRLNLIIDRTADGKHLLILSSPDGGPVSYWMMDRTVTPTRLVDAIDTYDRIDPSQIAPSRWFSYPARDGLTIPALLTLPVGYKSGPIPFVVLPHGGPTAHDTGGFDYWVQFLASRGYGVLQPQFRGSTGFGAAFERAGFQQWGLAMQDDVTDGTKWLIDQRLADANRIAIVGASYGGYAALTGAFKEPTLYRCAVALAPVADLNMLVTNLRHSSYADLNLPRIVHDSQQIAQTSPVEHAAQIRIPILLVHGRADFTVPVDHSEEMEQALKREGKSVEAIYLDGADHFLSRMEDRLAFLKALEKFLATQLGPGWTVSPS